MMGDGRGSKSLLRPGWSRPLNRKISPRASMKTIPFSSRKATTTSYYKYFWWGDRRPGGKSDFHAQGNKGQYIYISPQKKLIIVRNGIDIGLPPSRWVRLFYDFASAM